MIRSIEMQKLDRAWNKNGIQGTHWREIAESGEVHARIRPAAARIAQKTVLTRCITK